MLNRREVVVAAGVAAVSALAGSTDRARAAEGDEAKPQTIRLWEGDAPGAKGKEDADVPTLTVHRPPADKANGSAIVICPGGGYGMLAMDHEGTQVAAWLNSIGVTGCILKYRLGRRYQHPAMLHDVARAIRTVRSRAGEWGVDGARVGVLGFSAGGHLASTAATHFDAGDKDAADATDKLSSRPDVAVLIYPVIMLSGPHAHAGSRTNLLGDNPPQEMVDLLSNEKRVTDKTPPTFLVHSLDDNGVPPENSFEFVSACRANRVPCELHLFDHGGHGYGLGNSEALRKWPELCAAWLGGRGFLKGKTG
jgi:acetyl esterase/lipase